MEQTKPWWQSRTIWTALGAAITGILAAAGVLPPFITNTVVEETVTAILSLATIYFRAKAEKKVTLVK